MNVLILEPNVDGHHGPYLQWMAAGLVDRGFEVTVVTLPEALAHPALKALEKTALNDGMGSLRLVAGAVSSTLPSGPIGNMTALAIGQFAYWRLFRAWYRSHADHVRPDVIYLPYLDYCLYAIGLLGSPFGRCPWVGLTMRPSFHYHSLGVIAPRPAQAGFKRLLFLRALYNRHLRRLLTIDEPLASYLSHRWPLGSKATFFPEPGEFGMLPAQDEAKRSFGLAPDRKLILLYGGLTARKGVGELLRAMDTPGFPAMVDVLLAGRVADPLIQNILNESRITALRGQGRVKVIDRFIDSAEEPVLFAAADIVWVGYRGHYNASGVLVQAATAGRPVLACEEGVLGWQTRRHGLGRTVNPADIGAVVATIDALLREHPVDNPGSHRSSTGWYTPTFSEAQDALATALAGSVGGT